jgi:lantibiotic modifying enzyme
VYAATVLGADEHLDAAGRAAAALVERNAAAGGHWTCGVPDGDTTASLMLGRAGIGAALLRAADPSSCPPLGLVL